MGPAAAGWSLALGAASTAAAAYGTYKAGEQQKRAAAYNAMMQRIAKADAYRRGEADEIAFRRKVSLLRGKQIASMAASGSVVGAGSNLQIEESTAGLAEVDALTIRNNAVRQAFGFESAAAMSLYEGSQAAAAATIGTFGTVLGGATTMAGWEADRYYARTYGKGP